MLSVDARFQAAPPELVLKLRGSLTIAAVAEAQGTLLQTLAAHPEGRVRLDTQAVDEADSAGAQLLVALAHQLAQDGRAALATPAAAPLRRVLQALGLGDADGGCTGYGPATTTHDAPGAA